MQTTSILDANADRAKGHHSRRDIAQKRSSRESANKPWDLQGLSRLSPERRRDHRLLKLRLKGLNNRHWPFALVLNGVKVLGCDAAIEQRFGEQVRRDDGILNRVVDSHAADGRHRVRRVANQQQAGLVPPLAAARLD